ncbi:hypothetical protein AMAG_05391 [Allomyces macrogynus ATCC 38327]|uniref:Uncharacterized protein n=1 Tax=Allomyces macrogynus (strain ATCC 38327) TaxID=578462 RepID=A0A0L0SBZ5_ALLM3|nr:hypothetical protein AMAG_05391 [Allomyces macrogynus ATCC 38327]|eukprot:KNE59944.1 hypothetical protein AMAG_05391 [Allomyces macrogynus ATCC 38327]
MPNATRSRTRASRKPPLRPHHGYPEPAVATPPQPPPPPAFLPVLYWPPPIAGPATCIPQLATPPAGRPRVPPITGRSARRIKGVRPIVDGASQWHDVSDVQSSSEFDKKPGRGRGKDTVTRAAAVADMVLRETVVDLVRDDVTKELAAAHARDADDPYHRELAHVATLLLDETVDDDVRWLVKTTMREKVAERLQLGAVMQVVDQLLFEEMADLARVEIKAAQQLAARAAAAETVVPLDPLAAFHAEGPPVLLTALVLDQVLALAVEGSAQDDAVGTDPMALDVGGYLPPQVTLLHGLVLDALLDMKYN